MGSKIEILLAKNFGKEDTDIEKNKTVYGKPDLTFKKHKIAIFVDSELQRAKNREVQKKDLKSNQDFLYKKFERNLERDKEVNEFLIKTDWQVLRFGVANSKQN